MNAGKAARTAAALILGLAGGALFSWLRIPLPWMLGSLTVAAAVAIAGLDWSLPEFLRNFARPVIGVFAGGAFTLGVVLSMAAWWPILLFLAAFFVLVTALGQLFFARLCGLDRATAYFASTPGGLAELSLLGASYGASMRSLVVIHSVRVIAVVVVTPFLLQLLLPGTAPLGTAFPGGEAGDLSVPGWLLLTGCAAVGYVLGHALNTPSGVMLIPMALSALAHILGLAEGGPPGWLVAFVQVVIGTVCGARFAGLGWTELRSTVLQGLAWAAFMLAAAFGMALVSSAFVAAPLPALLLAFTPGGFAEVTIMAYAAGIEVAFVVACHVFRMFFVLVLAPPGYRLAKRIGGPPPATGS